LKEERDLEVERRAGGKLFHALVPEWRSYELYTAKQVRDLAD